MSDVLKSEYMEVYSVVEGGALCSQELIHSGSFLHFVERGTRAAKGSGMTTSSGNLVPKLPRSDPE